MNNRYTNPMTVRPSGYMASNIIPWPAVTRNRPAIAYYQRVMLATVATQPSTTPHPSDQLREDGEWGPITQRWVAHMQTELNHDMIHSGDRAAFAKYGMTRIRTDGVLDDATQSTFQMIGQLNGVPRGNFPVGVSVDRPTNNYVGGGADTTQTHFAMEPARTPANTPSPATQPAVATFPWGTVATVGSVALLIGFGAWAVSATKDNR